MYGVCMYNWYVRYKYVETWYLTYISPYLLEVVHVVTLRNYVWAYNDPKQTNGQKPVKSHLGHYLSVCGYQNVRRLHTSTYHTVSK
jgi:hypothetical protein